MGLVVGSYGPLLEHLTRRFGVSLPIAGSIISVHFGGGLAGVLIAMRTLTTRPARQTVMVALAVVGAGCAGVALAPTWPLFLAGILVIGFGFGALVIGLNQLVAYSEGRRRTALINGLNGAYSAGAVIGPVLIAAFAATHFSLLFLLGGAAALALTATASGMSGRLPVVAAASGRPGRLVGIFILAFILYVAVENGAAGWIASHVEHTGLSSAAAATTTSGFFLALAAGRLLIAVVPIRASESQIVLTGSVLATVALACATVPAAAPVAYVVTGLCIAPIFPTGIVWLSKLRPGDHRATAWLYPAASIGGVAGPGLIGIVIGEFGLTWTPVVLAVFAVAMTAAFLSVRRSAA